MTPLRCSILSTLLLAAGWNQARAQVVEQADLRETRPREDGAPLFERMSPERTKVHFENRFDHPDRWRELWRQYFNGSIGTGVALGDVDGDRLPDIFAVGKDSPNGLFLNRGDFRFEDVSEFSGVLGGDGFGAGASLVDIDGDGDLDIYVCYVGSPNELYLNDGYGKFSEAAGEWGLDVNAGSNAPSFADYDRDGDVDLYLQQNFLHGSGRMDGMPDLLFENIGTRFVEVTESAGIAGEGQGHVAVWWDYNEDGWPDIYVSNDFAPVDKLYRNNQDGTFTDVIAKTMPSVPYSAMGADLGDLNNDGRIDFLVAEMAPLSREYYHQALGPLTGKLLSAKNSGVNQYMQNHVSVSIGPGKYAELARLAGLHATDWTWASRLADLDNDGLLDAFFANGMTRAFHDADIALRVTKARSLAARVLLFEKSPPLRERNLAFRNLGSLQFENVSADWGLDEAGVSFAAAFADFDQDGDLDLVVSNWKENLSVYRNNSEAGSRMTIRLEGAMSNTYGLGARVTLEADGQTQTREVSLMRGYMSVDEPIVHFATQGGAREGRLKIEWPSGLVQVLPNSEFGKRYRIREEETEKEVEGGDEAPLFAPSRIEVPKEAWSEEEIFQVYRGQLLLPFAEDRLGPEMEIADLNGDGWNDIALGGATGQSTRVFLNRQGKAFESVRSRAFERDYLAEDSGIVAADFDRDGDLDLFVASGGLELDPGDEYYADRLYSNRGDGTFEKLEGSQLDEAALPSGEAIGLPSAGGGTLVLVAGGPIGRAYPRSEADRAWRIEGERVAVSLADFRGGLSFRGKTTGLASADLDGDGDLDVVQLTEFGPPRLWFQEGGSLEERDLIPAADRLRGLWRSAAIADFNGDGRVDIALGNLGLNTKYAVSPDAPGILFASDEPELLGKYIEAETRGGKLYPRESRIFHQEDFPDITRRTGSYAEFSRMTVQEAFTEELLARFDRYEFNETRSLILYQSASGAFYPQPLPEFAQAGVAIDLLAADVDGDGDQDLVVVNESLSPQPVAAIHRDTSFVTALLNNGAGAFESLLPWRSGLHVETGQPRRLAWADLDGDGLEELVVATNEGPLYIFQRTRN